MLTQLARNALAAAEAARAFSGVRDDARVAEACRRHEEELGRWREALRRNEFSAIAAQVGLAAREVGAPGSMMAAPQVLREAARTLAAVAEENVAREHGIYAGDRASLVARLDGAAQSAGPNRFCVGQAPLHEAWSIREPAQKSEPRPEQSAAEVAVAAPSEPHRAQEIASAQAPALKEQQREILVESVAGGCRLVDAAVAADEPCVANKTSIAVAPSRAPAAPKAKRSACCGRLSRLQEGLVEARNARPDFASGASPRRRSAWRSSGRRNTRSSSCSRAKRCGISPLTRRSISSEPCAATSGRMSRGSRSPDEASTPRRSWSQPGFSSTWDGCPRCAR